MDKEKIIIALDVPTAIQAREIIKVLSGEVGAFKIGLQLFTAAGASFVREIVETGARIFLDVKFHDIPNTVGKASIEVARLGVWMFNVHASGGGEMMRRAISEVREACARENLIQPKIIGVTVLTSSDERTLKETGIEADAESQVLKLARLAFDCDLDGVVASAREAGAIKLAIDSRDFSIVVPGVRLQTSDNVFVAPDDQKRVMTPGDAIRAGADYLVIGRPILEAENPVLAARSIAAEIAAANREIAA